MDSILSRAQSVLARWWAAQSDARLSSVIAQADAARDRAHWGEAAQLYRKVAVKHSTPFSLWVQGGNCAKEAGDLEGADEAYRQALAIAPRDSDLHLQLGHLRKLQGRAEAATQHYREAVAIDGNTFAAFELAELRRRADERRPPLPPLSWRQAEDAAQALGVRLPVARKAKPSPAERRAVQVRDRLLEASGLRMRAGRPLEN